MQLVYARVQGWRSLKISEVVGWDPGPVNQISVGERRKNWDAEE